MSSYRPGVVELSLLLCMAILPCLNAIAEEDVSPRARIQIPMGDDMDEEGMDQIKQLAISAGIEEGSSRFKQLFGKANGIINLRKESTESHPVVKHYQGTEGVALFSAKNTSLKAAPPSEFINAVATELVEQQRQRYQMIAKQFTLTDKTELQDCTENDTEREAGPFDGQFQRDEVLRDILFIRKKDMPSTPSIILGSKISIRPYEFTTSNQTAYTAAVLKIPCLPYRVRMTGKYVFRHQGRDALKNYDSKPNGKGVLHEFYKGGGDRR